MNNEKQHSEYKIIETVATPTFDGVSIETHPEDLLGGGETPFTPTPWKFYMDTQQTVSSGYVSGTTRKDALGNIVLDILAPKDGYVYIYDENGNIKYNFQPFESMILNKILPNFNQKTGAAVEKYGYMVVSEEAINLNDYLLIND